MFTILTKPIHRVRLQGTEIELWVSQRKLPVMMASDAMIVPVAPPEDGLWDCQDRP